ncbi:efflux RND transporter periplasmic adaptor subunit [Cardiobacteriaceae bacterium TAE3-ERU3]|nr:efflux RND transporter periplasmic adaptor subunit [Cardiobacteriaceae bacterium TAE3-ERU3]
MTVSIVQPQFSPVEKSVTASGYLEPRDEAVVNARLNGTTLEEIHAELGDWVEKGQVLARFDDALIQNDITSAKAQLTQAQVGLKQARDNAKRANKLLKADAMSRIEGERYISAEQDAQANVNAAQAQLDSSRLQLGYSEVKAPVSGIISDKQAVLGATANVGMPLFRIIANGVLTWRAQVSLDNIGQINEGCVAQVSLPGGEQVEGKVYNIAPTINQQSREVTVFVSLQRNPALRAGMLVSGEFLLGANEQMLIPANTIQPNDGRNYVWLVDSNDTAHRQQVELGRRVGSMVEVHDGLTPESRIVARGGGFLTDGDHVRVVANPEEQ